MASALRLPFFGFIQESAQLLGQVVRFVDWNI